MAQQSAIFARKVVAQVLKLSEKRVKQLTDDGILTEFSPGHYKLIPAVQAYIEYIRAQIADDDPASNHNVEKAKLTRAKREDAELALQLKRGELHRAADDEFIMTNMLIAFKAKLEVLPFKVLPSIINIPPDRDKVDYLTEVLREAVAEALDELAGYDPGMFGDEQYLAGLDDTAAEGNDGTATAHD